MKKTIFLILSAMAILLSACTASRSVGYRPTGSGCALVNPSPPTPFKGHTDNGVQVTISKRSSLIINVEDIMDYVHGAPPLTAQINPHDNMNPWVRWNLSF